MFANGRDVTCTVISHFTWDKSARTLEAETQSWGTAPECSSDAYPWVSVSFVDEAGIRRTGTAEGGNGRVSRFDTQVASNVSTRHAVYSSPGGSDQYSPTYTLPK